MVFTVAMTVLLSALFCRVYLAVARSRRIVAIPNERSSHSGSIPSGGGITIMLALFAGLCLAPTWADSAWSGDLIILFAIACLLAVLGLIDDVRGVSLRLRLLVYAAASLSVAWVMLQPLSWAGAAGLLLLCMAALAMLWSLNLYNFMDGIDGIAALQAVLACLGAAWLSTRQGGDSAYVLFCLLLAAAHTGFLAWNLPPARLFMGDAGSVPTGFLLAGLAILGGVQGDLNPLCWLVLLAVFLTDATWTLMRRAITRQPVTQGHRSHAYQRLSRRWNSHLRVDLLVLAINLLWLFPLAAAVQAWPANALIMVILAYVPLLGGMAKIGSMT